MQDKIKRIPLEYLGHKLMTYSIGEGPKTLLLISGGPGCPCNFLRDTHELYAEQGFRVVSWDQLGCGESDHVEDDSLWEIPRFIEEVEFVRQSLNLETVHLLGVSWGGVLGLEYTLAHPDLVNSFTIVSSAFNLPLMQRGFERHKLALGHETMRMMAKREANRSTDHPEYQAAYTLLAYRHLHRVDVLPECLEESMKIAKPMLNKVFGKHLFNCTGLLKNYDRTDDLHKITQPCLIIQGEYDYIITECATHAHDYLPNSELHILENCGHSAFLEDPETYHRVLSSFLKKHAN